MPNKAIQDSYADHDSHCYGCGRLNEHGMQIKSHWNGTESICIYTPEAYRSSLPGYAYGGLIASLIDCHGIGTAMAANQEAKGPTSTSQPPKRYITASLHVDFLRPTPIGPLELHGRIKELRGRKAVVTVELFAAEQLCARGEVIGVQIPDGYMREPQS